MVADCQEAIAAALSVFGIPSWSSASEVERVFYLRAAAVAMDAARAAVEVFAPEIHRAMAAVSAGDAPVPAANYVVNELAALLTPKGERNG